MFTFPYTGHIALLLILVLVFLIGMEVQRLLSRKERNDPYPPLLLQRHREEITKLNRVIVKRNRRIFVLRKLMTQPRQRVAYIASRKDH